MLQSIKYRIYLSLNEKLFELCFIYYYTVFIIYLYSQKNLIFWRFLRRLWLHLIIQWGKGVISSVTLSWVTLGLDLKTFGWNDSNFLGPSFGHPLHPALPMRTEYYDTKMCRTGCFQYQYWYCHLCHYSDALHFVFDWIEYFQCKQLSTIVVRNQSVLDLVASQLWIEANLRQLS